MSFPGRNPDNPFVINDRIFANSASVQNWNSPIHTINIISHYLAFCVGISLVMLVAFLILKHTPYHFKPYSKMLFFSLFMDVCILLTNVMFQPRVMISNGNVLAHLAGPVSHLSYQTRCSIFWLLNVTASCGSQVLAFEYYYRYKTVKNRKAPSLFKSFVYFFVSMSITIPLATTGYLSYKHNSIDELPLIDYAQYWYLESPIPSLIIASLSKTETKIMFGSAGLMTVASYVFVIIIAHKTVKELTRQSSNLTQRVKSVQKQFSSMSPLLTSVLPVVYATVSGFLEFSNDNYTYELMMITLTWYPIFNTMTTLLFIVPYRRYCLKHFFGCCSSKQQNAVIHVGSSVTTRQNHISNERLSVPQ